MMAIFRISLCVAWLLMAIAGHAHDPQLVPVESALRAAGLAPTDRTPPCGSDLRLPHYLVSLVDGGIEISMAPRAPAKRWRRSITAGGFEYTSENNGEFGGKLVVRKGRAAPMVLVEDNIIHLEPHGDQLLVIAGLSHLGLSSGTVYIVDTYATAPKLRLFTHLPEAPETVAFSPRRTALISNYSVGEIFADWKYDILTARRYPIPQPNSAVYVDTDLVIGFCGGVVVLETPWRHNLPPSPDGSDQITIVTYWTRR